MVMVVMMVVVGRMMSGDDCDGDIGGEDCDGSRDGSGAVEIMVVIVMVVDMVMGMMAVVVGMVMGVVAMTVMEMMTVE